jgi:hypothetical protein
VERNAVPRLLHRPFFLIFWDKKRIFQSSYVGLGMFNIFINYLSIAIGWELEAKLRVG